MLKEFLKFEVSRLLVLGMGMYLFLTGFIGDVLNYALNKATFGQSIAMLVLAFYGWCHCIRYLAQETVGEKEN